MKIIDESAIKVSGLIAEIEELRLKNKELFNLYDEKKEELKSAQYKERMETLKYMIKEGKNIPLKKYHVTPNELEKLLEGTDKCWELDRGEYQIIISEKHEKWKYGDVPFRKDK